MLIEDDAPHSAPLPSKRARDQEQTHVRPESRDKKRSRRADKHKPKAQTATNEAQTQRRSVAV
eukprot:6401873-Amphidinium_carterae.1